MKYLSKNSELLMWATVLLLVATPVRWAFGQLHDFRDMQGRTIKGRVVAFDAANQVVTLRRDDGKTAKMKLNILCGPDRLYVQDWGVSNDFSNGLKITAKLQSNELSSKATRISDVSRNEFEQGYEIRIENDSNSDFGKIMVDYCIFYRQGERTGDTVNYDEGIAHGRTMLNALPIGADHAFKTITVKLYSESGHQTIFGKVDDSNANVRGIWLRLKSKLPSGQETVREFRTSQDSNWKWSEHTIGVGLNKSAFPIPVLD